eukprot:s1018_g5.t1
MQRAEVPVPGRLNYQPPSSDEQALRKVVEQVAQAVNGARKVGVLVGVFVDREGLQQVVEDMLSTSRLPFATTFDQKAGYLEHLPNCVGFYQGGVTPQPVKDATEGADILLTLGMPRTEFNLGFLTHDFKEDRMIELGHDTANVMGEEVHGVYLRQLVPLLAHKISPRAEEVFEDTFPFTYTKQREVPENRPLTVDFMYPQLAHFVQEGDIVTGNTGGYINMSRMRLKKGNTTVGPTNWASLGSVFPISIGMAFAAPERRIVCLDGDGSFQMTGTELCTLLRHNLNFLLIILNNAGYTAERAIHPDRDDSYNDIQVWNYHLLPHALGGRPDSNGVDAHTEAQFVDALSSYSGKGLQVVNARLDKMDMPSFFIEMRCEGILLRPFLRRRCRSAQAWPWLSFPAVQHSGSFIFRFGWRGVGSADVHPSGEKVHPNLLAKYLQEEEWYTALTHWLFSVLKSLFSTMRPFKSEYVHQADVSFYMVCRSFDREKFEMHNWEAKLQRAYEEITNCQDEALLVAGLKEALNQGVKAEIDELLEYVGRMRAIGIQSRKVTNPKAFSWAKSGDEKSEKEKSNPKEDPSLPEPESQEKLCTEKVQVTNPKSDASTELEERSESSSAATQASETSTGPAPTKSSVPQTARRKKAAEGESKAAAQPAKAAVHEFRDTAPRPVDKGEFSSNWTHRQDRQQPSADAWAGQCLPAGDAWSVPWSEVHPLVAELEWTEEAYQPEAFYPAYPAMPNSHVHLMEMEGVCMDAMAGHGSMLSEDGCMLQADGMAFADDGMAVHHGALMPEDACMLQGDTMPGHMMHMDECMMMQDWPHSMVSGSFHVQAMPPPPPPAPPPPLAPREEAVATFLAGRSPSAPVLATTMNTSGLAVGSSSPVVAEPTEQSSDMQRQRPPTSSEQEALEAMNVSEEEGEDETNLRRRRHKKRREKDRPGGRRGKSDVLRAIRLMQREGRAPARPWHQRIQETLRSAILDMHQDSLQALRFGICFAMCWSLCSLVMSLIRFSSQYGGDGGDLTSTQGGAGR